MKPNDRRDESGDDEPGLKRYDWAAYDEPSTALVEAIADATDRDPLHMPPLYDHVDTEALGKLLASRTRDRNGAVQVTFSYDGTTVHLDSDGRIDVQ